MGAAAAAEAAAVVAAEGGVVGPVGCMRQMITIIIYWVNPAMPPGLKAEFTHEMSQIK
jgi:hypothetical protein